ncbi:MAG: hypothetical protein NWE89_03835 [Candidatus Bathyarchaeota archaeon]|nr:hypothetical protein [Candidatus Bathyarchaeota archaeon]
MPIHVEVWIVSKSLSQESESFSKVELTDLIKDLFNDKRSGVSTHISTYCVASTKKNPEAYRYLTKVGWGKYRVFKVGDEVHETKLEAPLSPDKDDIPSEYRYLLDISETNVKVKTKKEKFVLK